MSPKYFHFCVPACVASALRIRYSRDSYKQIAGGERLG